MARYLPEPQCEHDRAARVGVLLINLGTPDAPTASAVRRYLAEFLSDPRVVEIPRAAWLPILHGVILRVRPARSAVRYAKIWTKDGSPLLVHSRRQQSLLLGYLGQRLKAAGLPSVDEEEPQNGNAPARAKAIVIPSSTPPMTAATFLAMDPPGIDTGLCVSMRVLLPRTS